MNPPKVTDQSIERIVSRVLLAGVLVSGGIVLVGGIYFVLRRGSDPVEFHVFHGELVIDRIAGEIVRGAFHGRARSIIQLGILALIATPILRVAVALVGFALEKDRAYVIVTAIVLATLLFSLITGAVTG
jgi:uncharacterized membrane protein